jgi:Rho GDP-dissociation inhibitor
MSESETSLYATDHEEEDDEGGSNKIQLGPQYTLKEQLEKDKVFSCFFNFLCRHCI